jgi:hypothetical protein
MKKKMMFARNYMGFTGGHLKVFDYFNHVALSNIFEPLLFLTPSSLRDKSNPWIEAGIPLLEKCIEANAYFLGGLDWGIYDNAGINLDNKIVINLIQGFGHSSPQDIRYQFLKRPALRICVSEELSNSIKATGIVNGEIITIPNGIRLDDFDFLSNTPKKYDVFIGGLKSPELAMSCAKLLRAEGVNVDIELSKLPRDIYLKRVASSRIALLIPLSTEGFYLPALEAMALDVCVVVPDCLGNRSFCLDNINCILPKFNLEAMTQAVIQILKLPYQQEKLKNNAHLMCINHEISNEYIRFYDVLKKLST